MPFPWGCTATHFPSTVLVGSLGFEGALDFFQLRLYVPRAWGRQEHVLPTLQAFDPASNYKLNL